VSRSTLRLAADSVPDERASHRQLEMHLRDFIEAYNYGPASDPKLDFVRFPSGPGPEDAVVGDVFEGLIER